MGKIFAVEFNDDASVVASGSFDSTVRLWDLRCVVFFFGIPSELIHFEGHKTDRPSKFSKKPAMLFKPSISGRHIS
jgi:WD40 repeat protein